MKTTSIYFLSTDLPHLYFNEQICEVTAVLCGVFPDNILQGWFKTKTTSIFPVHGLTV